MATMATTAPKIKDPKLDPYLSQKNIQSIADTLIIVTTFDDSKALEAMADLRSVWRKDALGAAALVIKRTDKQSYDRLLKIVLKANDLA